MVTHVSTLYGAVEQAGELTETLADYQAFTLVLDPSMRVLGNISMANAETHNRLLTQLLGRDCPTSIGVQRFRCLRPC